jgi:Uma2 family endonuclease
MAIVIIVEGSLISARGIPLARLVSGKFTPGAGIIGRERKPDPRSQSMSTVTAVPPLSFHERPLGRLSVEKYEAMVDSGLLTKHDHCELIEGALVTKMGKRERHSTGSLKCAMEIARLLPTGWHIRPEQPVRIPDRDSEPEPDISVARGKPDDYGKRHPGPDDIALVVEISDTTIRADRALAATYIGGTIPVYWLVNVRDRHLEVYRFGSEAPTILTEADSVDLVIAGVIVGRVAVADLMPLATEAEA